MRRNERITGNLLSFFILAIIIGIVSFLITLSSSKVSATTTELYFNQAEDLSRNVFLFKPNYFTFVIKNNYPEIKDIAYSIKMYNYDTKSTVKVYTEEITLNPFTEEIIESRFILEDSPGIKKIIVEIPNEDMEIYFWINAKHPQDINCNVSVYGIYFQNTTWSNLNDSIKTAYENCNLNPWI